MKPEDELQVLVKVMFVLLFSFVSQGIISMEELEDPIEGAWHF